MENLGFFTSVRVPKGNGIREPFEDLEDLLQQEHGSDGKHPLATEAQSGFISPELVRKINLLWEFMKAKG